MDVSRPNRRQLLKAAGTAACACATCPLLALFAPNVGAADGRGEVDAGAPEDYARDGIYDCGKNSPFFLVSRKGKLYAVSSICTHKRVKLSPAKGGGGFKCPRHGSLFDLSGKVTKAPARKPLPRYAIRLDDGTRRVMVHPSKRFGPAQWGDPAAFVELKPG